MYFHSVPVDLAELSRKLAPLDRKTPLLIRADKTLALQPFVDVLDIVKNRGFLSVGLQTETSR